jgi:hypothetical protein
MQQQGQSGWQQPAANTQAIQPVDSRATPKLQASATATKTLGDALQQEQHAPSGNNAQPFNPDIDPNAAAMMMNQLQGGVSASSTAGGAGNIGGAGGNGGGAPMDPGAALMGALAGGGGGDALNSLSQSLAPALMMMMEVMPGPGQGAPAGGLPTFGQTSQMGYAPRPMVRRAAPSNPLGNIIPSGMVRSLMYQGVSRAMYH